MHNAMKVARWEIKRNLKNKSFLIGLFLTPVLIFGFGLLMEIMDDTDEENEDTVDVYIHDDIGVYGMMEETVKEQDMEWDLQKTDADEAEAEEKVDAAEDAAYIFLDEETFEDGKVHMYLSDDMPSSFMGEVQALETPIKAAQLNRLDLSDEELAIVSAPVQFTEETPAEADDGVSEDSGMSEEEIKSRLVTGGFAGIILLSIIISGMYIFQSASQEKKDKIAEIILSSVTPGELMQGKIIGYFILGMVQAFILLVFVIPFAIWKLDIPFFEYLFVPETLLLTVLAVMGYLLFAAIFVGIGATMADMSSAGQFQGMVMILPFLPFVFIGPVISNPEGLFAQIGSYIPFTSPGVLILRLSIMDEWPWLEIIIALAILVVSIWILMKLAGKIFKVGILMYGKNATPREIWRWLRA